MSTRAFCRYGLQKARTAVLLSLLTVLPAGAVLVGGTVKTEAGRPLPEVIVTDGEQFAFTDAAGRYRMEVSDSAEFVYLITPQGYVADCTDGMPRFWPRLRPQSASYDFTLHPSGSGSGRSVMLGMADPQVDSDEQVGRLFSETLPDMRQFYTFSPEYLRYLDGRWAAGDYVPQRTDHFFSAVPAPGARQVVIEAEDPYGTVYRDTVDVVGFCHAERK